MGGAAVGRDTFWGRLLLVSFLLTVVSYGDIATSTLHIHSATGRQQDLSSARWSLV